MKRFVLSAAVAAIAVAATAPSARAQSSMLPGFQIGASGGIAFPTGDLGNSTNTGYNIAVSVGLKPYESPIGLRFEAAYNEFGLQGGGGNINIPSFTANAVLALPAAGFTPYIIGGAGLYRPSADLTGIGNSAENDFGFNVGGGIKIPLSTSFETFIEARYNRVNIGGTNGGSASFIPVTVGIMW
ncbi:MAG: outer membrane beta-barrel protein [Gemmatimonadaceae bacterium]